MTRFFTLTLLGVLTVLNLTGQGFSGGFKAGLNFNSINGPLEAGESYSTQTGFHIAATSVYMFTDIFGVKGEFMFSQKGAKYDYEGDNSFFFFNGPENAFRIQANGRRSTDISITNSYIEIPAMAVIRLGRFEFEAGPSIGILVGSSSSGGITFSGETQQLTPIAEFTTSTEFRYLENDRSLDAQLIAGTPILVNGGIAVTQPSSIGAYYEAPDNDTNRYRGFDFGLNAGVAFFLNKGLYIGGRFNYGLVDVTNEEQDVSPVLSSTNEFVLRDDQDNNLSTQISIGFRF